MGKLRLTLTFVLFWIIIVFSCLLAENFAILSNDHMGGMNMTSLYLLTFFIIFMLAYYYFKECRVNKIKVDKILLPIIAIFGLVSILTVWWQGPREFVNVEDSFTASISFSIKEKISFTLQIIVWCAVLYGLLFVNNRYSISRKWMRWLPIIYVFGVVACSLVDLFMEFSTIIGIFKGTYTGEGITFIVYNPNVWGHLLLVGLLSCVILNIKKFNLMYYLMMIHLFIMIIFTSCTTAFFVGLTAIISYSLFEILSLLTFKKEKSIKLLIAYISSLVLIFAIFAIMVLIKVPMFDNLWNFISREIIIKDYHTLTSRTQIWASIFALLSKNPLDFIFGLGYKTGNAIFTCYFLTYNVHDFAIRSAHNGFMELLLRHGLFGLMFFILAFIQFGFGIVKLFKNKEYRVALFYLICVCGLLLHSVAESTMFLTPNIGGTYATVVFLLPVINETKKEYFKQLNRDLQQSEIQEIKTTKKDLFYFINTLIIGLIISLTVSLRIDYLDNNLAAFIVYVSLISISIISLFISPFIYAKLEHVSYKNALNDLLAKPIKDNPVAILFSMVVGLTFALIFPSMVNFNLFPSLLYTLCVFVAYNFSFFLFHKMENNNTIEALNYKFTMLLRKVSQEELYE